MTQNVRPMQGWKTKKLQIDSSDCELIEEEELTEEEEESLVLGDAKKNVRREGGEQKKGERMPSRQWNYDGT